MATIPLNEPTVAHASGPVFFAAGFRPFFLGGAIQAAVMVPLWLMVYGGGLDLALPMNPALWHAHEMVFGFAGAAIGGFLLTAVPNWTSTAHVSGRPLMLAFAAWLAARVAYLACGMLPALVVAGVQMLYLPILAVLVGRPLLKAGRARNFIFLPVLGLFWLADGAMQLDWALGVGDGMAAAYIAIGLVLVLIAIVGGRVVPGFTLSWLMMEGRVGDIRPVAWIEKGGAVGSVALGLVLAAAAPGSAAAGVVLLAAALIHGLRMAGWRGLSTLSNPVLWVLHLGYLWLVVGLALLGLASFLPGLPVSAAVHALTAGATGTMVMGIMSRAALGHSGRPLEVASAIVGAYLLLSLGAALRVAAPMAGGAALGLTHAGGALWALGWLVFAVIYFPILTRPRADGKPG
ncbi:MAG: NnrS family protein [Magnetospirillum sp.]|nr:NnrS family protein [Magnetospirillum sp.]